MQRRAAAAYFVFFLVVSVAAYAYIGVAESQRPAVTLDANAELTNDSTFTVDGTTYTASNIHLSTGGGGHGGGGGSMVADLTWTNESSQFTATLEHNTTTTYQNESYRVLADNESSTVTLREEFNVSQLLAEDPAVRDSLATQNGTQYVVYRNGTIQPLEEWLPEPRTLAFDVGDTYEYATDSGTQQATVASVSASGATLQWTAPEERSRELSEGGNVTLSGQQFFTHFPDHDTVQIISSDQYPAYQATLDRQDYFHERTNGLWGVSILSGIAAVMMLGMAYMPHRG